MRESAVHWSRCWHDNQMWVVECLLPPPPTYLFKTGDQVGDNMDDNKNI